MVETKFIVSWNKRLAPCLKRSKTGKKTFGRDFLKHIVRARCIPLRDHSFYIGLLCSTVQSKCFGHESTVCLIVPLHLWTQKQKVVRATKAEQKNGF